MLLELPPATLSVIRLAHASEKADSEQQEGHHPHEEVLLLAAQAVGLAGFEVHHSSLSVQSIESIRVTLHMTYGLLYNIKSIFPAVRLRRILPLQIKCIFIIKC